MKKQPVTLAIPTPCHENWQQMTPAEQGRFCGSCQKTVKDFTTKTDREVAIFFEQGSANTCGRFRPDQLQRPLHIERPGGIGNRLRALGIVLPGLLLGNWAAAQTRNQLMGKVACPRPSTTTVLPDTKGEVAVLPPKALIGDTDVVAVNTPRIISGKMLDKETGEPLIGALVWVQETNIGTVSDIDGLYSLQIPDNLPAPALVFSYVGYMELTQPLSPGQTKLDALLPPSLMLVGDVVVIAKEQTLYNIIKQKTHQWFRPLRERRAERREAKQIERQLSNEAMITLPEPVPEPVQQPEAFAVEAFPNPFEHSLSLRFDSPVAEHLTIRLTDMQGRTLFQQKYEAMKGQQVVVLDPGAAYLPAGQYLLEMSNGDVLRYAGVVVKG